ncbi:MAG: ABC transporter ATP-binding protein [bacterium]
MSLRIENVAFRYPNLPVLRDISFTLQSGEFLSLLGPNGCGKSTLLRLLDRILIPDQGNISLDGKPLSLFSRKEIARRIAFVPQESLWAFPFSVIEVVLMGRAPHIGRLGFESDQDVAIAREMMQLTDIAHLADKPITALSGGERQRALIARALTQEPEILLLDEPNAHLDISHQLEVFEILQELNNTRNLCIISVSHDLNLSAAFSKRILLLASPHPQQSASTIVALGTPEEVLNEERVAAVFGTPVIVDRHPNGSSVRISLSPTGKRSGIPHTISTNL